MASRLWSTSRCAMPRTSYRRSLNADIWRWANRSFRLRSRGDRAMADTTSAPATTPVTDRRPVPRGVLPRGIQTWVMAGIAGVMVLIIFVAGRPDPPARSAAVASAAAAPSADRLREYQDRLRLMETRAAQEALASASTPIAPPAAYGPEPIAGPSQ